MKKIIASILFCLSCIICTAQTIEYKSRSMSTSESIGDVLTASSSISIETTITFNYTDSVVIVNSANKKKAYWILRCYEDLKDYVDVTDNISNYTFTFLYNKYGVIDVLIMEDRKGKTFITDFRIYKIITH